MCVCPRPCDYTAVMRQLLRQNIGTAPADGRRRQSAPLPYWARQPVGYRGLCPSFLRLSALQSNMELKQDQMGTPRMGFGRGNPSRCELRPLREKQENNPTSLTAC